MFKTYLKDLMKSGKPSQMKVHQEMSDGVLEPTNSKIEAKCTLTVYLV